jgi:hypothetical protein
VSLTLMRSVSASFVRLSIKRAFGKILNSGSAAGPLSRRLTRRRLRHAVPAARARLRAALLQKNRHEHNDQHQHAGDGEIQQGVAEGHSEFVDSALHCPAFSGCSSRKCSKGMPEKRGVAFPAE